MIDSLNSASMQFLLGMDQLDKRIARTEREISTGRRIQTASDDPDQVSRLLQIRADIAQNDQLRANLDTYKLEEDAAANALGQANSVLEQAKSMSAFGINGTLTPEMQATLVQQVDGLMQDMVSISNTQANGRHLFSGDSDQTAPYALDSTQPNGVTAYAGSDSTRQAAHPDGSQFPLSKTGQEIFDSPTPGESIFGALASLRQGLINNDSTAIQSALASVQTAQDHLRTESVFYGTAQSRINTATGLTATKDAQFQSDLSGVQDADTTAAIVELQDLQFQRSATLAARAKLPRTSLFDYLG